MNFGKQTMLLGKVITNLGVGDEWSIVSSEGTRLIKSVPPRNKKREKIEIEVLSAIYKNAMDQLHMNYDLEHIGLLKKNKTQSS